MPLPIPDIVATSRVCAPTVSATTLAAIVMVESGGEPLAIGVNGPRPQHFQPRDKAEAIAVAQRLLATGANFDVGLGQINVRNLAPLSLSIDGAFDPCRNLSAAATVLSADYAGADQARGNQAALRVSLSRYNTGDAERGFRNGYVAKVTAAARLVVPALDPASDSRPAVAQAAKPPSPAWDVFAATGAPSAFVVSPQTVGVEP